MSRRIDRLQAGGILRIERPPSPMNVSALVAVAFLLIAAIPVPAVELTHGPVLGRPAPDSMRVWLRTSEPAEFRVVYDRKPDLGQDSPSVTGRTSAGADNTGYADLTGLAGAKTYWYAIEVGGELIRGFQGESEPLRFRTWPSDTSFHHPDLNPRGMANTTIAVAVCNHINNARKSAVYRNLLERHRDSLDLIVMNGDYIYENSRKKVKASEITIDDARADYRLQLEGVPDMARLFAGVPALGVRSGRPTTRPPCGSKSATPRPTRSSTPRPCRRPSSEPFTILVLAGTRIVKALPERLGRKLADAGDHGGESVAAAGADFALQPEAREQRGRIEREDRFGSPPRIPRQHDRDEPGDDLGIAAAAEGQGSVRAPLADEPDRGHAAAHEIFLDLFRGIERRQIPPELDQETEPFIGIREQGEMLGEGLVGRGCHHGTGGLEAGVSPLARPRTRTTRPETRRKWASSDGPTSTPKSIARAVAATAMPFCGIIAPASLNSEKMSA